MSRIVLRAGLKRRERHGRRMRYGLAALLCAALFAGGCARQEVPPDAIPDVPPLDYSLATEVPAGSISTVPDASASTPAPASEPTPAPVQAQPAETPAQPQAAPSPIPTATPATPVIAPATPTPVQAAPSMSREQRIAALELSLLNMNNELVWLKSQPVPVTKDGKPDPAASGASQKQAERIANLEGTIKSVQNELEAVKRQPPQVTAMPPVAPTPEVQATAPASASRSRPSVIVANIPTKPEPPAPEPVAPAPAASTPTPQPTINPETMTRVPVTLPADELANKDIPSPSRSSIATPPLQSRSTQASAASRTPVRPAAVSPAPAVPTPAPATTAPAATASPRQGEQAAYQSAYNAYEARRFNEAWNGFDRYLADYSNGRYAPNAVYWKGEVRYSLGDYAGAILLFKDVIVRFPKHAKASDALLKIIMSYDRLQDRDNASLHLRILNEDYPNSPAARRAKSMGLS